MTTVKKEKWREKVFPAGREVKGENVKNKENRKRKKQKNKNKKCAPSVAFDVFIFFFFFQVAQKFKSVFYM